jgi:hypothetical protein
MAMRLWIYCGISAADIRAARGGSWETPVATLLVSPPEKGQVHTPNTFESYVELFSDERTKHGKGVLMRREG